MILKNKNDLKNLVKSGQISKSALSLAISSIEAGVKTIDIENKVHEHIKKQGGKPAFLGYDAGDGPYPFATCISVNNVLVHGLPSKYVIQKGDIVTVDLGTIYNQIYTDTSYTIEVGTTEQSHFLNTGKKALKRAISQAISGNKIGDISYYMQHITESNGYTVSPDLVGHGIGKSLHESPQIPCLGKKNTGQKLVENQVLAIEIMYMKGKSALVMSEDNFGIETKDYSLSAQFEHTVLVKNNKPQIIV